MNFVSLIKSTYEEYELHPPVDEEHIARLINKIGALPAELLAFLRESDGALIEGMISIFSVTDHGSYTFTQVHEEWTDPEYRDMYPNGSRLLMFASDGMGGFFGYEKTSADTFGDIYHWDHEEDELQKITEPGLTGFIQTCEDYPD